MIKILLVLLSAFNIFAAKGVIRVLEAPLLTKEDSRSRILMNRRKGEVIHIHENSLNTDSSYYMTLALDGSDTYILKDYVKIITNDLGELSQNISYENDPTNYIINEPIPDDYPFRGIDKNKAQIQLSYSQTVKSNYTYTTEINRQQINNATGLRAKYLFSPDFDNTNRFYYGFHFGGQTNKNEYQLPDSVYSTEVSSELAIGPIVTYTYYRNEGFEIDTGIEIGFNLHRKFVTIEDVINDELEKRTFIGTSINGSLFTNFIHKNIFESQRLDFTHGPSVNFNSPYSLNSSAAGEIERFWGDDSISVSSELIFSYNLGLLYRF